MTSQDTRQALSFQMTLVYLQKKNDGNEILYPLAVGNDCIGLDETMWSSEIGWSPCMCRLLCKDPNCSKEYVAVSIYLQVHDSLQLSLFGLVVLFFLKKRKKKKLGKSNVNRIFCDKIRLSMLQGPHNMDQKLKLSSHSMHLYMSQILFSS